MGGYLLRSGGARGGVRVARVREELRGQIRLRVGAALAEAKLAWLGLMLS